MLYFFDLFSLLTNIGILPIRAYPEARLLAKKSANKFAKKEGFAFILVR